MTQLAEKVMQISKKCVPTFEDFACMQADSSEKKNANCPVACCKIEYLSFEFDAVEICCKKWTSTNVTSCR